MAMNPNIGFNPPPLQSPIIQPFQDAKDGLFSSVGWAAWFNQLFQRVKSLPQIQDTHANRVNYAASRYFNFLYFETDRKVYYASNGTVWSYVAGEMPVTQATLPLAATLTTLDAGLIAQILDYNHRLKWSTSTVTAGVWAAGSATITAAGHNAVNGQKVVVEGILPVGYNGVFTLTGITATTLTYVVANPGAYVSGGTVSLWGWAPGDEGSGKLQLFEVDPAPVTGWHFYDGTANVPYLKSDGTTALITLQDMTSAANKAAYAKMGSPNSAGVNAAVAPTVGGGGATTGASATGDTIPANTGNDGGAGVVVQAGAGVTVAAHTHTHAEGPVTTPTHTHSLAGITVAADGEPPNLQRRPWFRQ